MSNLRSQHLYEALTAAGDEVRAAATLATSHASDGEGLDFCLAELDRTYLAARGAPAPLAVVRSAALAWAECMQTHYNSLSCADPLTGLSSLQHVQSQVAALYRGAKEGWLAEPDVPSSHTLVVIGIISVQDSDHATFSHLEHALRQAIAADSLRELLPEAERPAGRLSTHRLAALTHKTPQLEQRVVELTEQLNRRLALAAIRGRCRVWTEVLPDDPAAARLLLDELAR